MTRRFRGEEVSSFTEGLCVKENNTEILWRGRLWLIAVLATRVVSNGLLCTLWCCTFLVDQWRRSWRNTRGSMILPPSQFHQSCRNESSFTRNGTQPSKSAERPFSFKTEKEKWLIFFRKLKGPNLVSGSHFKPLYWGEGVRRSWKNASTEYINVGSFTLDEKNSTFSFAPLLPSRDVLYF